MGPEVEPEPQFDDDADAPPGSSMELESSSVHVKATNDNQEYEVHDFVSDAAFVPPSSARKLDPEDMEDRGIDDIHHVAEGPGDCGSERLRRERVVLLSDLNSSKAKFELMLQTLRSILRLNNDASWVDMLERAEALAEGSDKFDNLLDTSDTIPCSTGDFEMDEAEAERELLEEKLEAQTVQLARLRELLHRQQKLLDMTADQIHNLHQENKRQAEQITELKQEQEDATSRESALRQETERLQEEVFLQQEIAAQLDHCAKSEAERRHKVEAQRDEVEKRRDEIEKRRNEVERRAAAQEAEIEACRNEIIELQACIASRKSPPRSGCRSPRSALPATPLSVPQQALIHEDDRDAFLSQFSMSSRTERQMRHRIEADKRRKDWHNQRQSHSARLSTDRSSISTPDS